MTPADASVIVSAIAAVGSITTTYLAGRSRRDLREINHAVNNRTPGAPTVSDQVNELHKAVLSPRAGGRRATDPAAHERR